MKPTRDEQASAKVPTMWYREGDAYAKVEFRSPDPFPVLLEIERRLCPQSKAPAAESKAPPSPSQGVAESPLPRAAGAGDLLSSAVDGDRPDAPAVNPRPDLAGSDGGQAPSGAGRGGVRDTSMKAYSAVKYSGELTRQQQDVLRVITSGEREDWTRKEIAEASGMPINVVCPRVHELLHDPFNLLQEMPQRKCSITAQTATPVREVRSSTE